MKIDLDIRRRFVKDKLHAGVDANRTQLLANQDVNVNTPSTPKTTQRTLSNRRWRGRWRRRQNR